ncbi:type II toxin-antitoxin system HicA family toxin [Collimonas silvisoli]|uniref:type II toxin-antitoxin system HicA family toxin n=1 Tax=Collimonas silvisoli TaxID=2825884 RepID=UPI001E54749E|nr:type II toxin-antitoxin system HicA family toxin [Collimonas silvisoli]
MSNARSLARGHKRLLPLIEYALREGWDVSRTSGGHLRFLKPGLPPIYTSSTASDYRAVRNARAMLQRAQQRAAAETSGEGGDRHG